MQSLKYVDVFASIIVANRNNNNADAGGEARRNAGNADGGEWNGGEEIDHFSFDDSDRFEEDSLCSWDSEESLCNNWRGWKRPTGCGINNANGSTASSFVRKDSETVVVGDVSSLTELAAKCVASFIPFELVEHFYPPVPEQLQLRIAFWSFPENEEDIRLYSCLANSSSDEFNRGDQLFKTGAVKDPLQIGFHLSATVVCTSPHARYDVAVTFDRRRISSCNCTCTSTAYWCSHVVAVCLHRIHCPMEVCLRAPVSESLTRLQRDQLQKFAQYLISELPQQILPTAQRLLDELLSAQPTAINTVCGAPDPTAGASINEQTNWYLDEKTLHANIKRILVKFCLPAPIVFSDVNYLTNSAPPAAAEWSSLLRPLRGREPEGMWNLLSIVREMFRRCDRNAIRLLEIITDECLACDQILIWWFQTKLSLMMVSHGHNGGKHSNTHSNATALQHACSSLCDEIVVLWRLAALNPGLAPDERDMLHAQFTAWHLKILDRVVKCRMMPASYGNKHQQNSRTDAELFIGFKPAIEACYLDWEEYPIVGITHSHDTNPIYYSPFTCFKHNDSKPDVVSGGQLNATQAVMANNKHYNYFSTSNDHPGGSVVGGLTFKHRYNDRQLRERCYISSGNHSSNSSSDSVHGRLQQGFALGGGSGVNGVGVSVAVSHSTENNVITNNGKLESGSSVGNNNGFNCLNIGGVAVSPLVELPSTIGGGGVGVDGNRSSASSEGFCENEDFVGDCNSTLCGEAAIGGQALHPTANQTTKTKNPTTTIESSDSQCSFEAFSSHSILEETVAESSFKIPLCKTALVSETSSSSNSSSSSSNSSTSLQLMATASEAVCSNKVTSPNNLTRRMSKEDSFSSDETGTAGDTLMMKQCHHTLDDAPSTSAAARAANLRLNSSETPANKYITQAVPNAYQNPIASTSASATAVSGAAVAFVPSNIPTTSNAEKPHIFSNVRPSEDAWDILLARSEGLHAHGHGREACILAVRLAEEMLANPPNLMVELPPLPKRKGKNKHVINPISHHLTVLASSTLSKCAFLCTVLSENSEHYHIAFRICLFALEMPRPPASTKPLEVKLANQEADILALLKKIPLNEPELRVIRERAEHLRSGTFRIRGEALLPINLATFIFDALVIPLVTVKEQRNRLNVLYRSPADENLGFEAAVATLGLKTNVSEAEHPLLCEGTRRQRGDLALTLLNYYKDEPRKIAKIMDKLLDRDIHILLKTPLLPAYYSSNPPVRTATSSAHSSAGRFREEVDYSGGISSGIHACAHPNDLMSALGNNNDHGSVGGNSRPHSSTSAEYDIVGGLNAMSLLSSTGSNGGGGNGNGSGSALSSQHISSTGVVSVSQQAAAAAAAGALGASANVLAANRVKDNARYTKGKRAYPSIPNQPSEASAHFMFELAKNVLTKAGGNSSTSLFTQATTNQSHHGPHRALHICAFQLGLYALGLHNCVSPNWLSRTYSSHVSWISGQAMEIGAPAISFLIDTWETHLTPPEAVGMADRASRGWDSNMIYPAAELALSVLPHAAALNPNEIQRAILQCKEQSDLMLERACFTVENAAKGGGVYPEVLFQVARYWYELYLRNTPNSEHEAHEIDDHHSAAAVSLSALIESQQHHELQQQLQVAQTAAAAAAAAAATPVGIMGPPGALQPQPPQPAGIGAPPPQPFTFHLSAPPPPYSFCQNIYHPHPHSHTHTHPHPHPHPHSHPHNMPTYPTNHQLQMYVTPATAAPPPTYPTYHHAGLPPQQQSATGSQSGSNSYVQQLPPGAQQMPPPQVAAAAAYQQALQCAVSAAAVTGRPPQVYPTGLAVPGPQNMPQVVAAAYYAQGPPPPPPNPHHQGMPPAQAMGMPPTQNIYPSYANSSPPQQQQQQQQQQQAAQVGQVQHVHVQPPPPQGPGRQRHPHQFSPTQLRYLLAAYNVGMLAMETLARRVHDDRPQAKYARNPPYGEDVKWLLRISKKLGTQYLHQFCICAVNSIVSPFVLHDVAIESAHYLGRNNHQMIMQHLRSALTPLVQKCQQMYIQCIHQKLYHLTQADYEDFANIILAARAAFSITPEGSAQFKDWLQSIKRSKSCKKELWTQINAALQTNSK